MKNLEQIKIVPVRIQVANILRKAILSGELEEGTELTLEEVAAQVGVSSMPVREAFKMLNDEGLVEVRYNKGAIVLGVNEKNLTDDFYTRAVLEGECCALAAENKVNTTPIEEILDVSNQAIMNKNYELYQELNTEFHKTIWELSGNKKMSSILSSMWTGSLIGFRVSKKEEAIHSFEDHGKILQAIKLGDADKARAIMKGHILGSMEDILYNLPKNDQ